MKPGLAVLPMEVWADVFDSPPISRQWLAQFANQIRNRKFAEKLQKYLHDPKCGKHSLRYLYTLAQDCFKPTPKCPASLAVASNAYRYYGSKRIAPIYELCEFPESELPENITAFKRLEIRHFDDQVLDFLGKIKPLFNNVYLSIGSIKSEANLRILFTHLLPMVASIRGIACNHDCVQFFEQHFPGTLARAKELDLEFLDNPAHIHTYLNWLNEPVDFDGHGPRFLRMSAFSDTIIAMIEAVRKHFLSATHQSTPFVLFIRYCDSYRSDEFKLENAATKEQLTFQNACFKTPVEGKDIHYAEVLRHPTSADAKLREWIKERAYFEKTYKNAGGDNDGGGQYQEIEQLISTGWPSLTMGRITKKKCADIMDQDEAKQASNEDEVGPSTSAKKMKK